MFKTARMVKFRAIFPQAVRERVISRFHEAGVVQLKEVSELEVVRRAVGEEVFELSSLIARFREMHDFLGTPAKPLVVAELTYAQTLEKAKKLLSRLEPRLKALRSKSEGLAQREGELLAQSELFEYFRGIEFPLSYLSPTERVHVAVGRIAHERVREFYNSTMETLAGKVFVAVVGKGRKRVLIIACPTEDRPKLSPLLYAHEVELLEVPPIPESPERAIEGIGKGLGELEAERAELEKERRQIAKAKAKEVGALLELLQLQIERFRCGELFGYTEATMVIEGWAPTKVKIEPILRATTKGRHIVRVYEPQKAEAVPTQMENPKVVGDFEVLTETYGVPKYDEVDPTPYLALTFPLFFALCVSDAGYGLMFGVFLASGLWIAKVFPRNLRMILLIGCALTVIVGVLMGGWLGATELRGTSIASFWVNPLDNPIPFLKLAVFVGILHILLGFGGAAALKDVFRRDWKNLFLTHLPKILVVLGFFGLSFCALGVGLREFGIDFTFPKMNLFDAFNPTVPAVGLVMAFRILFYSGLGIGVVGAVMTGKGVRERFSGSINVLYGVTGFVADAASYSRLMALGIATGIIAFAINYIFGWLYVSFAPSGILAVPLLILFTIVLFMGHCFNIFIQCLGAFIHTLRLHYVEFFGKFYEGGGEKFTPFKAKRVFTKIKGGE